MTGDTDHHAVPGGGELFSPASRRPTVAVIVPAYNEQDAIRDTVEHVRRALAAVHVPHEVVVNDGSDDETSAQARAAGAQVIDFPDNIGYGHALKAGIAATDSDLVAILDADGTYPPEPLPAMIATAEHADMVVGDRAAAMNNVPWVRRPAKWMLKVLASIVAQRRINNVNSGLRVFRRPALEQLIWQTMLYASGLIGALAQLAWRPTVTSSRTGAGSASRSARTQ